MIIIGYPGIGKSSYVRRKGSTIDLESSCFQKESNWAVSYCNVAIDLAKQGFDVFVSSHDAVRYHLLNPGYDELFAIYPSASIEKQWVTRLYDRYWMTGLEKDRRAFERAKTCYSADIAAIEKDVLRMRGWYEIKGLDYRLEDVIEHFHYICC